GGAGSGGTGGGAGAGGRSDRSDTSDRSDASGKSDASDKSGAGADRERGGIPWPLILGVLALLILAVAVYWYLKNRTPAPPVEEKPKTPLPPRGRPLPGAVSVVLGTAPNDRRAVLKPLTTISEWLL